MHSRSRTLGRAIERMLHAHPARTTVEVTLSAWAHFGMEGAAVRHAAEHASEPFAAPEGRRPMRWRESWWAAPPGRFRAEWRSRAAWLTGGYTAGPRGHFVWWGGEAAREDPEYLPALAYVLDPGHIVPRYRLRLVGSCRVAGRPCTTVHAAVPAWAGRHERWRLSAPWGADEHVLCVDDDLGIVMRCESTHAGVPLAGRGCAA